MSILSDFFMATPEEAQSFNANRSPVGIFPTLQARRVEIVKLIQLLCVIDGSVFEDHLDLLDKLILRSESDDGPWVFLLPIEVQESLAGADESQLTSYGKAWAATDEWITDEGKPDEVISLIKGMARLAKRAKAEGQSVFVWVSL